MYNKNNIAVAKVASKNRLRPELACVAFHGDRTIATDSFRLIEMSATGKKKETPILYFGDLLLKGVKLKKGEKIDEEAMPIKPSPVHGDQYPNTDKIFEGLKEKGYVEMKVNAGYLAEVCNVLKELDAFGSVILKVPTDSVQRPIIMTAENKETKQTARALIMPMTR